MATLKNAESEKYKQPSTTRAKSLRKRYAPRYALFAISSIFVLLLGVIVYCLHDSCKPKSVGPKMAVLLPTRRANLVGFICPPDQMECSALWDRSSRLAPRPDGTWQDIVVFSPKDNVCTAVGHFEYSNDQRCPETRRMPEMADGFSFPAHVCGFLGYGKFKKGFVDLMKEVPARQV